jgi:hypothetical protein
MADRELVNMIISRGGIEADLRDANLRDAILERVNLEGADLTGADLTGADLRGADLSGADLSGADLYGADLSRADLRGADFTGAYLISATLTGANLKGANLTRADLDGANLKIVTYDPQTKWPKGFTPPGEGSGRMASRKRIASIRWTRGISRGSAAEPSYYFNDPESGDVWSLIQGANAFKEDFGKWIVAYLSNEGDLHKMLRSKTLHEDVEDAKAEAERRIKSSFDNLGGMVKFAGRRMGSLDNSTAVPAIGDILVNSWGYDQTNVNFYEVVGISGSMITIQEIGKKVVSDDNRGSQKVMPVPGRYTGKPMRKKHSPAFTGKYGVKIHSYAEAYLWNGKPEFQTAAGYGR